MVTRAGNSLRSVCRKSTTWPLRLVICRGSIPAFERRRTSGSSGSDMHTGHRVSLSLPPSLPSPPLSLFRSFSLIAVHPIQSIEIDEQRLYPILPSSFIEGINLSSDVDTREARSPPCRPRLGFFADFRNPSSLFL